MNPVVVGVDGSPRSDLAVQLAVRMAESRRRPLRLVHAFVWPMLHVPLVPPPGGPPGSGLSNVAERIAADAVAIAKAAAPSVDVVGEVITGWPAPVLVEAAAESTLLVVGDRGLGGFGSLLLGSVAVEVGTHAACPIVVARGVIDRVGDVLVGVDGSPHGARALDFAFDEAARRGVGIVALHAYSHPAEAFPGDMLMPIFDLDQLDENERLVAAEALAGHCERYPDTAVATVVVRDSPAHALIRASDDASLVVVGSRGLGGFRGLALGSVTHAVMHHASCPVAIVRH